MAAFEPRPILFTKRQYDDLADMGWLDESRVEFIQGALLEKNASTSPPGTKLFTRNEYYAMKDLDWFGDTRVELIEGEIIEMSPPYELHIGTVNALNHIFATRIPTGFYVSIQNPLVLGLKSDPQPDVTIVVGNLADGRKAMPKDAALVIEVAESSLRYDQTKKAGMYAKGGVSDYWIVNLVEQTIEVYRNPVSAIGFFFGFNYLNKTINRPGEFIVPLNLPNLRIAVGDVLP